jgi:preprotein translocase subunit YajC
MNILDLIISPALAETVNTPSEPAYGLGGVIPIIILAVIFYFLLIRPQQKRSKEHKNLLKSLKIGDEIVTNGGVVAKVVEIVDESFAKIEIAKGVTIKVQKQGINQKIPKGSID